VLAWSAEPPPLEAAQTIMSIAGHVSRAMLSRYSHVRMEAKRRALDEIAARQNIADEKRKAEAERVQRAAIASESVVMHQCRIAAP
jgi:hypothetical protein